MVSIDENDNILHDPWTTAPAEAAVYVSQCVSQSVSLLPTIRGKAV